MPTVDEILHIAEQIQTAWNAAWLQDIKHDLPPHYCTLDDCDPAVAASARAAGFLENMGGNTSGDIAGFVVDHEIIALFSDFDGDIDPATDDAELPHFNVRTTHGATDREKASWLECIDVAVRQRCGLA